jgi:hypothetical protein
MALTNTTAKPFFCEKYDLGKYDNSTIKTSLEISLAAF